MNKQFRRWNLETTEIWQITHSTLHWWQEQGRPLVGAFIEGSVAQHGKLLPGSDIDLCIVTPDDPDPTWFEERVVSPYTIEIYPLAQSTFDDLDWVLAQPALPFNLCEGIVLSDSLHLLANVQARLTPHLCLQRFQRKRLVTCFGQAQEAYHQADVALEASNLAQARLQITIGLWNTIGMVCAFLCRCPTNRRGFVLLWQCASQWQRPDVIEKATQALGGTQLTWQELEVLTDQAALMKERARESILSLRDSAEAMQAVWPLLCTVIWEGSAAHRALQAQQQVLAALHYETQTQIAQRYHAASDLTQSVWDISSSLSQTS
ncbi:nucleotidyltransferase domain-containing protein [Dictyobacter formicarum]|uniref:Polymerase nucleotidyl transferase domain-containing protein n=1 Tax=Dictyobacter formicarum TaxID=2778368 RepID=A0ABQ3VE36_9CHLR|nr:nucleotidyltransferase domain-containing protein [Dictyobacter formicarum]GHO84374.1 hypothetical protein KSZ_23800 [Dictyobacter formicarum]